MYEVGDIILIETSGSKKIRKILSITKAGNFKTKDSIITKNGRVRGDYFGETSHISMETATYLSTQWKASARHRQRINGIIHFEGWSKLSAEIVVKIHNLINGESKDE